MNKILTSLIGIVVFTSIMSLLSKFFDIDSMYYFPFMMWIIAIFVFLSFKPLISSNNDSDPITPNPKIIILKSIVLKIPFIYISSYCNKKIKHEIF